MTSLSDKVARVKELHAAVGYNSKDFSPCAEIRFFQHGEQMAALINELWDENQKQREVLGMAREDLDYLLRIVDEKKEAFRDEWATLTAIDNVMKGE